jgi:hypothetical protein
MPLLAPGPDEPHDDGSPVVTTRRRPTLRMRWEATPDQPRLDARSR